MNTDEMLHGEQDAALDNQDIDIDGDDGFGDFDIPDDEELDGDGEISEEDVGDGDNADSDEDIADDDDDWLGDDESGDDVLIDDDGEGADGTNDEDDGNAAGDSASNADGQGQGADDSAPPQVNEKDAEIARLRSELTAFKKQAKDALKAAGYEDEDEMHGLARFTAEMQDKSVEDYLTEKAEKDRVEEVQRAAEHQRYQSIYASDLAELHAAYPETKKYSHIRELPPEMIDEFCKYRGMGLSAKKAYAAANPDGVRTDIANAVKRQALNDTKAHLMPVVSKRSSDNSPKITRRELAELRLTFPKKSDKEIIALWKQTNG